MQDYLEAIHARVCPVCMDAVLHGDRFVRCGLAAGRTCPVETYLPEVVSVVESVDSSLIEDYVTVLREKVCAVCGNQEAGDCTLRLQAECALDRYFMLVAEAILAVNAEHEAQTQTIGIP